MYVCDQQQTGNLRPLRWAMDDFSHTNKDLALPAPPKPHQHHWSPTLLEVRLAENPKMGTQGFQ